MKRLLYISTILLIFITSLQAQETIFEEKRTIYRTEQAYGLIIHTTGWGINWRYGKYTSGFSRKTYEVEIVGVKHPKEIKSFSDNNLNASNAYVFGKLNSILLLRGSKGISKTFISKQSVRGIAISYILNGGFSFLYAKPVYLEVRKEDGISIFSEIERYDPDQHDRTNILGKASSFRGLFKGRFYPGVFLKAGLNFEYARQASRINAIEVGVTLDAYLEDIPIMANELNRPFLYNLYITLAFGSKKTQ